jgi:prepilin-type N-terminal cleavage/methylation domain-containing protein
MRASGYTLLEMVVVLALLGLAVGMTAPAGFKMINSWRDATQAEQVLRQLAALPTRARNEGRPWDLLPDQAASQAAEQTINQAVTLPDGWSLQMDTPLHVRANGACNDADGRLITPRQTIAFHVQAPFCRIQRRQGE